jgi:hypothetical protein
MTRLSARFTISPNEVKRYIMDWTSQLSLGETVTGVTATVAELTVPVAGTPPFTVTGIVLAPTGAQAIFYGQGGGDGHNYEISFLATTSVNQVFEDIVEFDVASKQ